MKFKYLLCSLLTLFSTYSFSQNNAKLIGKITDENGEPVMQVSVVIDASKGWGAVSDIDGNYELAVPAGTYTVLYKYIGKEDQNLPVTLAEGETKTMNLVMKEEAKMIDVVVVTGTKYASKLSEQTISMDVVRGSSLTNQNITNLENGMTRVPGVTIADGQVNIRGGAGWSYGAGSRVLVMVDDLPLLTSDAADAKWSIIPMENVDQLEVIKGAASALYGSGALNGIINVRTAYPTDEPYTKVTLYGGITEAPTRTPTMAVWGKDELITQPYTAGVNFAHRQKFGQNDMVFGGAFDHSTGYLDSSDSHAARLTLKYRHRFKKVPGLNAGINMSGYYSWGNTFFFWQGLDTLGYKPYSNTITTYKTYRFTVDPFLNYTDLKGNNISFKSRFFNSTNTNNTGQGSVANTYYTELQYSRRFEFKKFDFNIVGGVVNSYGDVNPPKGATGSLFGKNTVENFSVYAQTDFKFFKKLTVSLGARWEYFNMKNYQTDTTTGQEILANNQNSIKQLPYPLFRAGVNYQAAEATYIRASFGQGFRYPTIAERYVSTSVGPLTIASNPNLEPEKGYSAEFGVKQGFKIGKNWTGFADAAFFWNQYENMMEFTFGQFGNPAQSLGFGFSSQNIGRTRILGTEITLGGQGTIGDVTVQFLTGYNFIDPRALNFNDSLEMYNYLDQKLDNKIAGAYNQNNRPDGYEPSNRAITYGMTSSSSTNLLKYRNRHTFKFDLTLIWKGLEWNSNLQYASYAENIDYAFVSPVFRVVGGSGFLGLDQYRKAKEQIPIGKGRGDIVWNMHLAYNFKQGVRVAFLVKNLLNWEYTPRPASFAEPRNYQLQVSYTFRGKAKKTAAN